MANGDGATNGFSSTSGIPIKRIYTPEDTRHIEYERDMGDAAEPPFRRGVHAEMYRKKLWTIFDQDSATDVREEDRRIVHGILSLLYVARRRDVENPGMGPVHLEAILGCPQQHMEFHIWYLKQRGWIETLSSGQLALTADGVDKLGDQDLALRKDRLLSQSSMSGTESQGSRGEKPLLDKVFMELHGAI